MRNKEDNNIANYTVGELTAMRNRYYAGSTTWQPFTCSQVEAELENRKIDKLYKEAKDQFGTTLEKLSD